VTKPLAPSVVNDFLKPNPASWGADGYPAGFSVFGMPVVVNPGIDHGTFRLVQDRPRPEGT
jgi:hypothetical protein